MPTIMQTGQWVTTLRAEAAERERAGLRRHLVPRAADDPVIDFAGNDYLGLARDPRVLAAAADALHAYGLGATGSRLVRGSTAEHAALESELAAWLGTGGTLVYSSGYLANLGALRALATPGTVLISDAYNHASIVDGCRASRARTLVTPHRDLAAVEAALISAAGAPTVIVTESVFSVDGDLAPLPELYALARAHGARLLVDEAHAGGLIGPDGAGGLAAAGLAGAPDVVATATLSKAFGASGGVVAGPAELIAALVDTGRTFIYDTALPPAVAAGARAALRVIRADAQLRAVPARRARQARDRFAAAGFPVSEPVAGVLSVTAAGPAEAVAWAAACRERGVAVGCFRPPSTPDGSSRLRLTINAGVPEDAFVAALDVIVECAP